MMAVGQGWRPRLRVVQRSYFASASQA